jgi:signal transduction histidine kinase
MVFTKLGQKAYSLEDAVASNNYLMEYKRKDLLVQTDSLQDALDEISLRNKELQEQKIQISEQAEKLRFSHELILEKNSELEQQTESLLDQSDYLHEANETITTMHQEVQRQKTEIEGKSRELEALNMEKNNLIGIVAHDLKSPLNQIKGLAAIIKMTSASLNAEALHCVDMIDKSATRLSEMINKILDIEAIESKKLNLKIENIDLTKLLTELVERHVVNARQKQVEIFCTIEPTIFAALDKGYTEQVFENILSNSLKFSPAFRSVYVKLHQHDNRAIVEIKDEGPGLNEEDKKKLFGKYQKLSAKPTGNETSTGLGLSIVKKFVEAMNGEIWCVSEEGNGASFFVSFTSMQKSV